MKKITLSTVIIMIMSINTYSEDKMISPEQTEEILPDNTFAEAFKNGKASGQIRVGTIYANPDKEQYQSNYTTAIGGQLKYETAAFYGFSLGAAFYTSHTILGLSGNRSDDKYNEELSGDSHYDLFGEAYITYQYEALSLRIGRQLIDTPYADADDIRMTPNTFEGAVATYGLENVTLFGAYLTKWQGPDSEEGYTFQDLTPNGDGVAIVGTTYGADDIEASAWYYHITGIVDIYYADISDTYTVNEKLSIKGALQFSKQNEIESSGVEGTLYGALGEFTYEGLTFGIAYNKLLVDDTKEYFGGFGGGVGFVNMFEFTAGVLAINQDIDAWKGTVSYEFSTLGTEGLTLTYDYGEFKGNQANEAKEHNLMLTYAPSDTWDFEFVYEYINDVHKDLGDDGTDFSLNRVLARANYNF